MNAEVGVDEMRRGWGGGDEMRRGGGVRGGGRGQAEWGYLDEDYRPQSFTWKKQDRHTGKGEGIKVERFQSQDR